jgi:hypothetical protein
MHTAKTFLTRLLQYLAYDHSWFNLYSICALIELSEWHPVLAICFALAAWGARGNDQSKSTYIDVKSNQIDDQS